jgi:hypothetical protein
MSACGAKKMSADIIVMPGCKPRYLEELEPEPEVKYWRCSCGGIVWFLIGGGICQCVKCQNKSKTIDWAVTEVRFDDGA